MYKIIKEKKYIITIIIIFIICFMPVISDFAQGKKYINYYAKEMLKIERKEDSTSTIGEIIDGYVFEQSFICEKDSIAYISLEVATYNRNNSGTLEVELIDIETQNVLEDWKLSCGSMEDNSTIELNCEKSKWKLDKKGKTYLLRITSIKSEEGNAVTLYCDTNNQYEEGTLFFNGSDTGADLLMTLKGYDGKDSYNRVRWWLCIYLFLFVGGVYAMFFSKDKRA